MKRRKESIVKNIAVGVCLFAALVAVSLALVERVNHASGAAEAEMVRSAARSAALTCYAVECAYPSSLDYLKEHYGLSYDEDTYIVVYNAFASNTMPEIRVLKKGADGR